MHHASEKLCKMFLLEFRQISTNFDNFWQKDGRDARWTHFPPHLIRVTTLPC